ncbi:MAG: PTS transporter subunit EIIC [Geodermatophilaceae bacterium]
MITYLLPLLIGYTGGRMVHGQRGAVVGAIATMGVIVGSAVPMFLGAMIIGPLAALLLKLVDGAIAGKVKAGFEMLVDNFAAGILGGAMAIVGKLAIGPVVENLTSAAGDGVESLVDANLLPLVSILVEPAKVLFLNNAINQGVLTPLGIAESAEAGKSILFMIETNPGPGFGILIAYLLFGPKALRPTVPGAMIIHFLGGIHEIYFPYVLMKPRLILAAIAGGASGVGTASILNAGLVSTPSPGSIFAYLAVTPRGGYFSVLAAIVVATGVSFAVASALLGFGRGEKDVPLERPEDAGTPAQRVPSPRSGAAPAERPAEPASPRGDTAVATRTAPSIVGTDVRKLVVACDAGMGSSVMLASQLRKRLAPYDVTVEHTPVNSIPAGTQVVLCHADLADRARGISPGSVVVTFKSFMGDPAFDRVEAAIRDGGRLDG